jgi:Fe-S-cluster-containing hydrogenase component 2
MTESSQKRLVIDLRKCDQCQTCTAGCGYYERPNPGENGLAGLRQRATFALICRRCLHASCIEACAFNALERGDDAILQIHNLRCVSCKMCAHACPFGTIYTDMLPFYQLNCDPCLDVSTEEPSCVSSCPHGALEYRLTDVSETDVHVIDPHLAARAKRWVRREVRS